MTVGSVGLEAGTATADPVVVVDLAVAGDGGERRARVAQWYPPKPAGFRRARQNAVAFGGERSSCYVVRIRSLRYSS